MSFRHVRPPVWLTVKARPSGPYKAVSENVSQTQPAVLLVALPGGECFSLSFWAPICGSSPFVQTGHCLVHSKLLAQQDTTWHEPGDDIGPPSDRSSCSQSLPGTQGLLITHLELPIARTEDEALWKFERRGPLAAEASANMAFAASKPTRRSLNKAHLMIFQLVRSDFVARCPKGRWRSCRRMEQRKMGQEAH